MYILLGTVVVETIVLVTVLSFWTTSKKQVVEDKEIYIPQRTKREIISDFVHLTLSERLKSWYKDTFVSYQIDSMDAVLSGRKTNCIVFLTNGSKKTLSFSLSDIGKTPNPIGVNVEGAMFSLVPYEEQKKEGPDECWIQNTMAEIVAMVEKKLNSGVGFFITYKIPENKKKECGVLIENIREYGWTPLLSGNDLKVNFQNNM